MPVYQGTYYERYMILTDDEEEPIDITGWTFECDLRDADGVEYATLTTSNGSLSVGDGPEGLFRFAITPTQSADLPTGTIYFDVLRTDHANGDVWLFGGKFKSRQPVTR